MNRSAHYVLVLAATLLLFIRPQHARAQMQDDPQKPNVAVVIFDGVQIIDFTGPFEVFGQYNRNDVYTVAATSSVVTTTMGMKVVPNYRFEDAPPPDVLVVPGGDIGAKQKDAAFLEWIRSQAGHSDYVLSVCNGAFLLAEAGLLDGLEATTFYGLLEDLQSQFPEVTVVDDERFVDNGKIITSAGLSSGIDAALYVQGRMHGRAWANVIALNMEYDWRPDTDYARPHLADLNIPSSIYDVILPDGVLKVYDGDTRYWQQTWQLSSALPARELSEKLAAGLADEGAWQRVATASDGTRTEWMFTGRDGEPWSGELAVRTVSSDDNLYEISIRVETRVPQTGAR